MGWWGLGGRRERVYIVCLGGWFGRGYVFDRL